GNRTPCADRQRRRLQARQNHDHGEQAAEPSERRDEADEESQAIDGERIDNAVLDENPGGLVPARIERHGSGLALELVGPDDATRREEPQLQLEPPSELRCHVRSDREVRPGRLDRIFEARVEEPLVPEEIGRYGQPRALKVGKCVRIAPERLIRQELNAHLLRRRKKPRTILEKLNLATYRIGGLPKPVVDPRKIQIAGTTLREG